MTTLKSMSVLVTVVPLALGPQAKPAHERQDPRTQPELVRIVAVARTPGGDPAFTGVVNARVQSASTRERSFRTALQSWRDTSHRYP
jgi:hypothetical protein